MSCVYIIYTNISQISCIYIIYTNTHTLIKGEILSKETFTGDKILSKRISLSKKRVVHKKI